MRVQLLSAFRAESGTMHISKFGCLTLPNAGALSEVDTRIDTDRRRQRQGRIFQIPGSSSQGGSSFRFHLDGRFTNHRENRFLHRPELALERADIQSDDR